MVLFPFLKANLFMGLGAAATNSGTGNGSPLILDTESRGIRTTTGSNSASSVNIAPQSSSSTTISSSANQSSPGLNLLSHHLHRRHHHSIMYSRSPKILV